MQEVNGSMQATVEAVRERAEGIPDGDVEDALRALRDASWLSPSYLGDGVWAVRPEDSSALARVLEQEVWTAGGLDVASPVGQLRGLARRLALDGHGPLAVLTVTWSAAVVEGLARWEERIPTERLEAELAQRGLQEIVGHFHPCCGQTCGLEECFCCCERPERIAAWSRELRAVPERREAEREA
jgi:hypothetical protein